MEAEKTELGHRAGTELSSANSDPAHLIILSLSQNIEEDQ